MPWNVNKQPSVEYDEANIAIICKAMRTAVVLLLTVLCIGCSGARYATHWDGRRGYDGSGDYGYDLVASNGEARSYRARAARYYPAPGDADDPWSPYIREAANRFQVPERWIHEVMEQESGGRLYDDDGSLITSPAGAMGLMQVMPQTYDLLQQRYQLDSDPYEPRNNIMAGTAYIREMYDRYGVPGFLAAYNAGPDRLDAYLTNGTPLPDETVNYVASIAPRLGDGVSGPLAAYAGAAVDRDRAYAGGGMIGSNTVAAAIAPADDDDPSMRAFPGGGLVTTAAPTGTLSVRPSTPVQVAAQPIAVAVEEGAWSIQVGAYTDPAKSSAAIDVARAHTGRLLFAAKPMIVPVQVGRVLYRARLGGLSATAASAACAELSSEGLDYIEVPPGS